MKLYYIVNARIPTEKAHGWQICQMCSEFARQGLTVELVAPDRAGYGTNLFAYYGLPENFSIRYLKIFDFLKIDRYLPIKAIYLVALFFLLRLAFLQTDKDAVIYTRNPEIAWLFSLKKRKVFFDAHTWPTSKIAVYKELLSRVHGIVCNSGGTAQAYSDNGFENLLIAPNAVDPDKFDSIKETRGELREKLLLPIASKIIMYVGHLYEWKGTEVTMAAARQMKETPGNIFILIGGTDNDIARYRTLVKQEGLANVIISGHKPQSELPAYLKAADLLLLPNVASTLESEKYTSPIKMFEYMASRRLIIASDLPSLREVLNEKNSRLFKAGDAEALVSAINEALKNPEAYQDLIEQTYQDVQKYTWKKRGSRIIEFMGGNQKKTF